MLIFLITLFAMVAASVACIFTSFSTFVKSILILLMICSTLSVAYLTSTYRGLPSFMNDIPPQLIVYGQYMDKENGIIHFFAKQDFEDIAPDHIVCPYNLELHKAANKGRNQSKGQPYIIKTTGEGGGKNGEGKGKGKQSGNKGSDLTKGKGTGSLSLESKSYNVYQMPPPILPEKQEQYE